MIVTETVKQRATDNDSVVGRGKRNWRWMRLKGDCNVNKLVETEGPTTSPAPKTTSPGRPPV